MKHLLTAIACCLAVAGSAQTPYNPDSDGDNLIGTVDLMSLLPLYGGEFYADGSPVVQIIDTPDTLTYNEEGEIYYAVDLADSADVVFFIGDNQDLHLFLPYSEPPTSARVVRVVNSRGANGSVRVYCGINESQYTSATGWLQNNMFQTFWQMPDGTWYWHD